MEQEELGRRNLAGVLRITRNTSSDKKFAAQKTKDGRYAGSAQCLVQRTLHSETQKSKMTTFLHNELFGTLEMLPK